MNFYDMDQLIAESCDGKKKKDTVPKKWKGTVAAMKQKHPDKFDPKCKDPDKLCPYAIANSMANKGAKPGYEPQDDTEKKPKEKPEKEKEKEKEKNEAVYPTFSEWFKLKETSTSTGCVAHFALPVGLGEDEKKKKDHLVRRNALTK